MTSKQTSKLTENAKNGRIVAWAPPNQPSEYFLRGCGPLRPLSEAQAQQLRQRGVAADLPETMPLKAKPE